MEFVNLVVHGVAVIGNIGYGYELEHVVKGSFGADGERFESYAVLILLSSAVAALGGLAVLAVGARRRGGSGGAGLRAALMEERGGATTKQLGTAAGWSALSTYCQYHALAHVSFTTLSVLSCIRFLPVCELYHQVRTDGLNASRRSLVGLSVAALGAGSYFSNLRTGPSPLDDDEAFSDFTLGLVFAAGWVGFDHLATKARAAYASPSSPYLSFPSSLLDGSPALAHFIWLQALTSAFALAGLLVDTATGSLLPSLALLATDTSLPLHLAIFALTSAFLSLSLLSASASLGSNTATALDASRTFVSVAANCALFRHLRTVSLVGWCGVGWVGSGVFYQLDTFTASMDGSLALSRSSSYWGLVGGSTSGEDEDELLKHELGSRTPSPRESEDWDHREVTLDDTHVTSSKKTAIVTMLCMAGWVVPAILPAILTGVVALAVPDLSATIKQVELVQAAPGTVEGGDWENQFHAALAPACGNNTDTLRWPGTRRTFLVSNPRSGNTFTRELVERATNYQTSTVAYCDASLGRVFKGECDHDANFLVKSHYPDNADDNDTNYVKDNRIDQIVHLVRNPLDATFSGWQMSNVPKTADGQLDHSARLDIDNLGATDAQLSDVLRRADIWLHHTTFWRSQAVAVHTVRYEDLMKHKLATLMSLLAFLLPTELPSLAQLACVTEADASREAYASRKAPEFSSWPLYEPRARVQIVERVKVEWCRMGYDLLLRERWGTDTGVDDICSR